VWTKTDTVDRWTDIFPKILEEKKLMGYLFIGNWLADDLFEHFEFDGKDLPPVCDTGLTQVLSGCLITAIIPKAYFLAAYHSGVN
jgi:hypothetical protein